MPPRCGSWVECGRQVSVNVPIDEALLHYIRLNEVDGPGTLEEIEPGG